MKINVRLIGVANAIVFLGLLIAVALPLWGPWVVLGAILAGALATMVVLVLIDWVKRLFAPAPKEFK